MSVSKAKCCYTAAAKGLGGTNNGIMRRNFEGTFPCSLEQTRMGQKTTPLSVIQLRVLG